MSLETQWLEDVFPIVPFLGDMLVFGVFFSVFADFDDP